ncbi:MAG: hypothetical protein ABSF90_28660 [Syntrophobacteraceae bacterium]|jgi:hypothetical protein
MPPRFFSIEFHTRFFPALLWGRLHRREREGTGFPSTIEFNIVLAVCVILVVFGIPAAVSGQSVIGWASGALGSTGIVVLSVKSIASRTEPPSYDQFLAGVFFFFVALGISAGIFAGALYHSFMVSLCLGTAGLASGYASGILAGLWLQYLGRLASTVDGLAGLAALGVFFVDIVLLAGRLLKAG